MARRNLELSDVESTIVWESLVGTGAVSGEVSDDMGRGWEVSESEARRPNANC